MPSAVNFRPLQAGDIAHIAEHLRAADRDELRAAKGEGVDFHDALGMSVLRSSHVWIAADAEPVAVFGVAPVSILEGIGSPWFLSTPAAYKHPRALVVEGKRYLARMREVYPNLVNYVDERNEQSIRWLKRIGFTVHPAEPYGVAGRPFHRFTIGVA